MIQSYIDRAVYKPFKFYYIEENKAMHLLYPNSN